MAKVLIVPPALAAHALASLYWARAVSEQDFDGTVTEFVGPDGFADLVVAYDRVVTF